jgi:hypothetical protein
MYACVCVACVCVYTGFVRKNDMVEHVARLAWDAAIPFMRKPLLRAALVKPLAPICAVVNRLGISDRQFQVGKTQCSMHTFTRPANTRLIALHEQHCTALISS